MTVKREEYTNIILPKYFQRNEASPELLMAMDGLRDKHALLQSKDICVPGIRILPACSYWRNEAVKILKHIREKEGEEKKGPVIVIDQDAEYWLGLGADYVIHGNPARSLSLLVHTLGLPFQTFLDKIPEISFVNIFNKITHQGAFPVENIGSLCVGGVNMDFYPASFVRKGEGAEGFISVEIHSEMRGDILWCGELPMPEDPIWENWHPGHAVHYWWPGQAESKVPAAQWEFYAKKGFSGLCMREVSEEKHPDFVLLMPADRFKTSRSLSEALKSFSVCPKVVIPKGKSVGNVWANGWLFRALSGKEQCFYHSGLLNGKAERLFRRAKREKTPPFWKRFLR